MPTLRWTFCDDGARRRYVPLVVGAATAFVLALLGAGVASADPPSCDDPLPANAKLPDLRTVVPQQLQIVNPGKGEKRELLRFSNGIANVGDGPWRMRPELPTTDPSAPQLAIQELLDSEDSSGTIVCEAEVSQFEFHEEHNHWHIDGVALYEIRASLGGPPGSADIGSVIGENSIKTTFCLIDWIKLDANSNNGTNSDRVYWDCFGDHQGISVGWVDQYHHATDGQELDLTELPAGLYYLVSTANPDGTFIEKDYTNNGAWVAFELTRESQGKAKLAVLADGAGLQPSYTTNR